MTWSESVDEALCFGWIDGIRKSLDEHRYVIRFTPRKPGSTWSLVNTKKVRQLIQDGRMQPAGLRAWERRDPARSGLYSFEQREHATFSPEQKRQFKSNKAAWTFFQAQPPGYRKITMFYVTSAKQEATRVRRLQQLIDDSAAGQRIGLLRRPSRKEKS